MYPVPIQSQASSRKPQAFTLIELLVVVTIIVVLLALLVPAMDKALVSASSAVCMTNLRNWSLAMRQYTLGNRNRAPAISEGGSLTYWWAYLSPFVGEPDFTTRQPTGWVKANICPDSDVVLNSGIPHPVWGPFGTYWGQSNKVWQWGDPNTVGNTVGAYGANLWLFPAGTQSAERPNQQNFWQRYLNAPGETPQFGDSIWIGGWPDHTDEPPVDTENGNASSDPTQPGTGYEVGGMMGRWTISRHSVRSTAINLSFVDGSARNVRLGELWNLRWHANFQRSRNHENRYP